ncbi:MAG: RHS repeat-associated core domain-containing protein [Bacteroidales bacterium]|nr:RHS repeat-associated core domain-containing protein [Bacteroidales bacterium]
MQYKNETYWKYEYNLSDHLGNVRIVFAAHSHGQPELMQQTIYYPYGMILHQQNFGGTLDQSNKMLYNGKELQDDQLAGMSLDWYDYGARFYDPQIGRWHVVDPHAERYPEWSPYSFVFNNPTRFIDPDGRMAVDHIDVEKNTDGTYTVVGGEANANKNIYVVNSEGNRTGEVVGEMLTEYSFHDNDGNAVVGAIIDPSDNSGQNFMDNEIIGDNPGLVHYMRNATGGEKYDFKTRDIPNGLTPEAQGQYHYRGGSFNGKIASARDIGNYGAGYVAGRKGLRWGVVRVGFDALESYQQGRFATEGQPTQQAQRLGHSAGSAVYQKIKFERQWQRATNPWPVGPKW